MAQDAIDRAVGEGGLRAEACTTAGLKLIGSGAWPGCCLHWGRCQRTVLLSWERCMHATLTPLPPVLTCSRSAHAPQAATTPRCSPRWPKTMLCRTALAPSTRTWPSTLWVSVPDGALGGRVSSQIAACLPSSLPAAPVALLPKPVPREHLTPSLSMCPCTLAQPRTATARARSRASRSSTSWGAASCVATPSWRRRSCTRVRWGRLRMQGGRRHTAESPRGGAPCVMTSRQAYFSGCPGHAAPL